MPRRTLKTYALVTSLGALTACPADAPSQDTEDPSTGGTSGMSGDTDPTGTAPPTTTDTTPPDPTSGGTDTGSTAPDVTSTDPTVDPSTGTTDATTTDETTTGGVVSTLCTRLGGMAEGGIPALVTGFFGKVIVDERINGYFLNSDIDAGAIGMCVIDQLGALAQCEGVAYGCKSMKDAHMGLGIAQQDFDDFVMDFVAAYDEHAAAHPDLTAQDKTDIADALGGMAADIVEDPTSDASVYQRVGRKPAIKTLIGHPGEMGSFIDNVAMDPAIAGFFMDGFERLNTCLTRQVASIDGPIKYGAEVTAPDGIDPGVAIDNPCRDMKSAHAGLMDDMMAPITYDDFTALVADLITAMTTAGVTEADQMAILAVLGPMCDDIVSDPNACPGNTKSELIELDMLAQSIDNLGNHWDGKYTGKLNSMLCNDLIVADDELNFVNGMTLKVGIDHTFLGDLTIKINSPDGKVFTPLSRAGSEPQQPLKDDGIACCGDNSNLSAAFPFTFTDKAVLSAKDMGKTLDSTMIVCKDENPKLMPCEFKPYPGLAPGKDFSDYKGVMAPGTWQVCIGDSSNGDYGKLQYLGLTIERARYMPK